MIDLKALVKEMLQALEQAGVPDGELTITLGNLSYAPGKDVKITVCPAEEEK
jgi:hypothetical protein